MDFKKLTIYLKEPIPNTSIMVFRMGFALILLIQTYYFISNDFINENIVKPLILFPFIKGFEPMSKINLIMLAYIMLISNIGMLVNKTARISTLIFLLSFTYFWLLDKGYFNNHYYFISLICFLLFLVNQRSSFQNLIYVPRISLFSLQAMICITYFIAGVNKLNPYWLFDLQPMTHILEFKSELTGNNIFQEKWVIIFGVYFGLFFDLFIPFLLFIKKTRIVAFILVFCFNIMNYYIFYDVGEIGVFPFLMISTLILFIDPKTFSKIIPNNKEKIILKNYKPINIFIICFLILQLILPFRHHLFTGYVDYNGIGQRFSWRMKIMYKESNIDYFIIDKMSNQKYSVDIAKMLTNKQYNNIKYFPDLIVPLAIKIKSEAKEKFNIKYPKITCTYKSKFMGKMEQLLFSPELDLSQIPRNRRTNKWLFELKN